MPIVPKKMTLMELCRQLSVTAAWVGKALRDLRMPGMGRGKERSFSSAEFVIFKNVLMLRTCGLTWNEIKEIRRREKDASLEINAYNPDAEKFDEDEPTHWRQVSFYLEEPCRCAVNACFVKGGKSTVMEKDNLRKIAAIIKKHKLDEIEEELQERNLTTQAELRKFAQATRAVYKLK